MNVQNFIFKSLVKRVHTVLENIKSSREIY